MLNFDADRFVSIQSGAVGLAPRLDAAVTAAFAAGRTTLVLLGTGGAGILMEPAVRLLQNRSRVDVHLLKPAEVLAEPSTRIGAHTLVVIPSLSGTTAESVAALEACRAAGAHVLALTAHADSALAQGADEAFVAFAEDDTSSESFYVQSLVVALSAMKASGDLSADDHARMLAELATLPKLLLEVKRSFEPRARGYAERIAAQDWHVVSGAGSTWAQAFYYGMCILEEMQWIRTRPVHASDFFHGTLELVEDGVSLLLLKGEDAASRALVERVEAFAPTVGGDVMVLDSAEADLPGLSQDVRALVSPAVLATVLERVSAHLEVLRDHPLTTRRYYKRLAY